MRAFLGLGGLFPVSRILGHAHIRARAIGLIGDDLALWVAVPVACVCRLLLLRGALMVSRGRFLSSR